MRICKIFVTGCTLAAGILLTATATRTQTLSQPDGWEVRAERFVAMPPGFHITTSPSVLLYHPEARAGAGLNLHLISLTVESDGATTEWAPVPAESSEGDGA